MQLVDANDPILRQVCRSDFRINIDTLLQMFEVLREKRGVGLAAPQVGIDARFFITHWGDVFVNPKIADCQNPTETLESCLSFPELQVKKRRWLTDKMEDQSIFTGPYAIMIQHEIDHLNGVCIG